MVVFGQKRLYSGKVIVIRQTDCIRQSGCTRKNVVEFGQMWLYSCKVVVFGKIESIRTKLVVFGQKLFYTGRSGSIRAKVAVFGQGSCIRAKWLSSGKVVVFEQMWLYLVKVFLVG